MKTTSIYLLLNLFLLTTLLQAQSTFKKTYDSNNSNQGKAIIPLSNGQLLLLGSVQTDPNDANIRDLYLRKTDQWGNSLWYKQYRLGLYNQGAALRQTSDGNIVVAASSGNNMWGGDTDLLLFKCTTDGDVLWQKTFGGDSYDLAKALIETDNGDLLLLGDGYSYGNDEPDLFLARTNSEGTLLWSKSYGSSDNNYAFDIVACSDNNFIITASNAYAGHLVKINNDGQVLWSKHYGNEIYATAVAEAASGDLFLIGTHVFPESGATYLAKLNSDGTVIWTKEHWSITSSNKLFIDDNDVLHSIASVPTFGGPMGMVYAYFQSNGNLIGTVSYDGSWPSNVIGETLHPIGNDGFALLGTRINETTNLSNTYLIKVKNNGTLGCDETYSNDSWIEDLALNSVDLSLNSNEHTTSTTVSMSISEPAATTNELLCSPSVIVQASANLQGAYDTSTSIMRNDLLVNGLLPLTQPFTTAPWYYEGTENINNPNEFPSTTVDWVLLEARASNDPNTILAQGAALLLNDGTLVQHNDSLTYFSFKGINAYESYYISLKTRNHLAVISNTPIILPNTVNIDFSNPTTIMGGSEQLSLLSNSNYALIAGDFNADGIISVADYNAYIQDAGTTNSYTTNDCNLDGSVTVNDYNHYAPNASAIGVSAIRY